MKHCLHQGYSTPLLESQPIAILHWIAGAALQLSASHLAIQMALPTWVNNLRVPNLKAVHLESPAPIPDPDHDRRPDVKRNICVNFSLSRSEIQRCGWAICTHHSGQDWQTKNHIQMADAPNPAQEGTKKKATPRCHQCRRTFVLRHRECVVSHIAPAIDALGCLVTWLF